MTHRSYKEESRKQWYLWNKDAETAAKSTRRCNDLFQNDPWRCLAEEPK